MNRELVFEELSCADPLPRLLPGRLAALFEIFNCLAQTDEDLGCGLEESLCLGIGNLCDIRSSMFDDVGEQPFQLRVWERGLSWANLSFSILFPLQR